MALKVSKNAALTDIVSETNKIDTKHINTGEEVVVQLWLFNDNSAKKYEGIQLTPADTSGSDESGWFKLSTDGVTYGASGAPLNLPNVTNANQGMTFYLKVTSTHLNDSQNKTDLVIDVTADEFAV